MNSRFRGIIFIKKECQTVLTKKTHLRLIRFHLLIGERKEKMQIVQQKDINNQKLLNFSTKMRKQMQIIIKENQRFSKVSAKMKTESQKSRITTAKNCLETEPI